MRSETKKRRHLLVTIAVSLASSMPCALVAQQSKQVRVIGRLAFASTTVNTSANEALKRGMRDLGYVEGRDFVIEYRTAGGQLDELPRVVEELVKLKVDVIVTGTDETARAAQQATTAIPIVAFLYNSPKSTGLIESLGKPGGNTTGIAARQVELVGKRLELLKETVPDLIRAAVFWDSYTSPELQEIKTAANSLGVELLPIELKPPYDLETAFRSAKKQKSAALIVLASGEFYVRAKRIGALAREHRLPTISALRDITEAGGLMSYGTDPLDGFYRVAYFIDRIFKGATPGELPVEQIDVKLILNMRTAKALGLIFPQAIMLRAEEVIR
jgi:putative ABC transport system substrate-binding protein